MFFWVDSTSLNFRRKPAVKKWKVKAPPTPRPRPIQQVDFFCFACEDHLDFIFILFCVQDTVIILLFC